MKTLYYLDKYHPIIIKKICKGPNPLQSTEYTFTHLFSLRSRYNTLREICCAYCHYYTIELTTHQKKQTESYWNADYTFITDLSATNTTLPVIQCILRYISFITVHSTAAVIGCLRDAGFVCDKAAMLDVAKERPSTKHK
jgi:hypothetical protein